MVPRLVVCSVVIVSCEKILASSVLRTVKTSCSAQAAPTPTFTKESFDPKMSVVLRET